MSMSAVPLAEVVPVAYVCPILCAMMVDPVVVAGDGHTYERRAIEAWFSQHSTSPLTGAKLQSKELIPNHALRNLIEDYCRGNDVRQRDLVASRQNLARVSAATVEESAPASSSSSGGWQPPVKPPPPSVVTVASSVGRPVIVCASRKSLNNGEGCLVAFEPTEDGTAFESAFHVDLKLDPVKSPCSYDESISALCRQSPSSFVAGGRNGALSLWQLTRRPTTSSAVDDKVQARRVWSSNPQSHSHQQEVTCLAMLRCAPLLNTGGGEGEDYSLVASGSRDYLVKLWRASSSLKWQAEVNHRSEVFCVAGTRDGLVVSGGADWSLKVWDANSATTTSSYSMIEPVQVLDAHSKAVKCCALHPTQPWLLASGSEDETLCVWDLRTNRGLVQRVDTGSAVRCVYWQDDGQVLCAGGGVTMDSWSGASAECMGGWLRMYHCEAGELSSSSSGIVDASIYPTTQGGEHRSDGDDRRLRTAHVLATMGITGYSLRSGGSNQMIVSGGDDKRLRVWSMPPGRGGNRPRLAFELGSEKSIPISVDALETLYL